MEWLRRKARGVHCEKAELRIPTLVLQVGDFGRSHSAGVFEAEVEIEGRFRKCALYFGPRMGTGEMVLEIYFRDRGSLGHDENVSFRVLGKIRDAMVFNDLGEVEVQLGKDLDGIRA
jgi:FAD synthase